MIAIDTNLLVYAHRRESSFHDRALKCIAELVSGGAAFVKVRPRLWNG